MAKKTGKAGARPAAKPAAQRSARLRRHPDVDAWFDRLEHPLKTAILDARRVILAADPRISESVKWRTPTFSYHGDLVSLIPTARNFVSLMFHRGSEIPGRHPRLEGDARLVRTMRFADRAEVRKYKGDLERVVRAWCDLKEG